MRPHVLTFPSRARRRDRTCGHMLRPSRLAGQSIGRTGPANSPRAHVGREQDWPANPIGRRTRAVTGVSRVSRQGAPRPPYAGRRARRGVQVSELDTPYSPFRTPRTPVWTPRTPTGSDRRTPPFSASPRNSTPEEGRTPTRAGARRARARAVEFHTGNGTNRAVFRRGIPPWKITLRNTQGPSFERGLECRFCADF